jgi:hypothetical protein
MASSQFLTLKAYIIEMIISIAAIGLGLFIWWPMNGTKLQNRRWTHFKGSLHDSHWTPVICKAS